MTRTVKVAVVGSGLAGLTAAYRLAKTPKADDVEFEVHVFEKAGILGMDSHSVDISTPSSESASSQRRVDVPMRSFQGGYYNQLISLYTHLGVHFRQADFSYSFAKFSTSAPTMQDVTPANRKIATFAIYDGASGRKGISVPAMFFPSSHSSQPSLWNVCIAYLTYACSAFVLVLLSLRMAYLSLPVRVASSASDIKSSSTQAIYVTTTLCGLLSTPLRVLIPRQLLPVPIRPHSSMTFREWIDLKTPRGAFAKWAGWDRLWQEYARDVLVPLYSAVCTSPEEMVWDHPVEEFLDFAYLTLGTHHYVVENGVRDVVQRISAPLRRENIHLASPIVSLAYNVDATSSEATIDVKCTNNTTITGFGHIVFATQANQAAPLLRTYIGSIPDSPDEGRPEDRHMLEQHRSLVEEQINCLGCFTYCQTVVVNHTDPTLMPDSVRDRRDLNLMMADDTSLRTSRKPRSTMEVRDLCLPPTYAMATHVLPQSPQSTALFQTTNPIITPVEGSVLSVTRLERAVASVRGKEALSGLWREEMPEGDTMLKWGCVATERGLLGPLQGAGRLSRTAPVSDRTQCIPGIWLCGSYAHGGIPLLEGCVASGRNVVEQGIWVSEGVNSRSMPELW